MAVSITQLFAPAQLGTSVTTYYTVPSTPGSNTLISARVRFANTTGSAATVTAYAIQSGGTATDSNTFFATESVPANSHVDVDVPVLAAGGFIQAKAGTATAVTISSLSGTVYSN